MNSLRAQNPKQAAKLVRTGYRMLKILTLLIEKPCNYKQINDAFLADFYLKKNVSDDMICMYINTLREVGCDISRPCKSNNFCYVLSSHPFELKISSSESKVIETILKSLIKSDDWKLLVETCEFFAELKNISSKDSDFNFLRVISTFLKMDFELVKKLAQYCEAEKFVILDYYSPNSGLKEIALKVQRISLENSKLYLWGYSYELKELQYLRLDRIKKINVVSLKKTEQPNEEFPIAVYKLLNQDESEFLPDESQKVLKIENGEIFVQETVFNKFSFVQKILSYGEDCVLLEPSDIRAEVVLAIKGVLSFYDY